jgi:hypothetical protein
MHRLVEIIGPAPSELSEEDLHDRIIKERQRVSGILAEFKAGNPKKAKLREESDD